VDDFYVLIMVMPIAVIIGGLIMGAMALHHRARLRELAYRERIAMIERGLMPPPEVDPKQFERTMSQVESLADTGFYESSPSARYRSGGIVLVGIGVGVFFIVAFAGEAMAAGVGVGGAIAIVGAALLLNSCLSRNDRPKPIARPREPSPPRSEA